MQGIAGADSTVPGPAGVAGANGSNGLPGADSTVPGPAGANGLQGERGLQGLAGADSTVPGPAGANGLQGERGLQGFTGSQGLQGVQGIAGADSTVAGPAGATGSQGLQGIQGVKGVDSTSRGDFGNTDLALTGNRVHTAGGFNFSLTGLNDLSFTRPGAGVSMVSAETVLAHTALVRLNTPKTYIGSAAVPVAPSAILEVDSTTKGVLFPRLTTTQKNAIAAPATGLMVVDITLNAVSIFNGTGWVTLTTQTELASEATARTNADTVLTNSVTSIQSDQITLLIYKVSNFATI